MSLKTSQFVMTNDQDTDMRPFGYTKPISKGPMGTIKGGTGGGGFHALLNNTDRDRGFLTQSDREFLLKANWDDKLPYQTVRNTRLRIRNRILSMFFDARFLRYISEEDRNLIFENARDAGHKLHFREAFKELVRFTYLGLYDFEFDTQSLLEAAIEEAERDRATTDGECADVDVDITVTTTERDSVEQLKERYENHDELTRSELAVLVNSNQTEISLVDALYYTARQPDSDPYGYSWEDPDVEDAEEILSWLRDLFDEYDIDTFEDHKIALDRLRAIDEDLGNEYARKVNHLTRVAPNFNEQLAKEANLPTSDMALLHNILWNPNNIDVKTALEQEARPPTAGGDWDPATDESLQKFITRIQAARKANELFTSGGEEGRQRWAEVLEIAEFDAEKWSEYMQEQLVEHCATELREKVGADHFDEDRLRKVDSWEEYWESMSGSEAQTLSLLGTNYGDDVMNKALERVVSSSEHDVR